MSQTLASNELVMNKPLLSKGSYTLVHLILLVAETPVALFSRSSFVFLPLPLAFYSSLVYFLCCVLDEWFSKGKILPFVLWLT